MYEKTTGLDQLDNKTIMSETALSDCMLPDIFCECRVLLFCLTVLLMYKSTIFLVMMGWSSCVPRTALWGFESVLLKDKRKQFGSILF